MVTLLHDFNTSRSQYGQWGVLFFYGKNALQHEITSINSNGPSVFAQVKSISAISFIVIEASNVT